LVYSLTYGQAAASVLSRDAVLAAKFPCERLALAEFSQFKFPTR
jgi:hypothetical protein